MDAAFVPGLTLADRFYREAVRPILDAEFPALPHAAALVGSGSEVLGFDIPVSTDHHWGPRVQLFLSEGEHAHHARSIRELLRHRLPHRFLGWPTNFTEPDPLDHGTQRLRATHEGPVNHRVDVLTLHAFVLHHLGFDLREDLRCSTTQSGSPTSASARRGIPPTSGSTCLQRAGNASDRKST